LDETSEFEVDFGAFMIHLHWGRVVL